ncbi:hypothetical protein [Butyrivibrio sp. WCD2001]|uniref:hypothetical protein n=1 Tax=Butyrivibrio sp. WCD2001 TaxID=1280681 RepID=UPI0003F514B7|nr:hypothetical protein [Butyrivibrio sp. WCD2001]
MKKYVKQLIQWIIAALIAGLIMNTVLFFYNSRPGWIERTKGATTGIYTPNSYIIKMTEGKGCHKSDSRGYVNNSDKLADHYVIAVGASHTQGKEVDDGERYTDLLNEWLGYKDEVYVYNVSEDGYYLPYIINGFKALTEEFPDAEKIIIEIATTSFDVDLLKSAYEQREFDQSQLGENIFDTLSLMDKMKKYVKQYSPLLYNAENQLASIKKIHGESETKNNKEVDIDEYRDALDKDFDMMTSLFDKEIIILYHPNVELNEDGGMTIKTAETDGIFKEICEKYDIAVVDMSDKFREEYENNWVVSTGFSNTTIAEGHLNKEGHRMIAEELLKIME